VSSILPNSSSHLVNLIQHIPLDCLLASALLDKAHGIVEVNAPTKLQTSPSAPLTFSSKKTKHQNHDLSPLNIAFMSLENPL
jgi:hypothetical protein